MKMSAWAILLIAAPWAIAQAAKAGPAPQTTHYSVVLLGTKAGHQDVTSTPEGLQVHYEFNDRGRGPVIDETIKLTPSGLPGSVEIKGVDYYKATVSESFSIAAGKAKWANRAENGERPASGDVFYSSVSGAPIETLLLVKALLRSPGQKLAMLPQGEVSLEKKAEKQLEVGGQQRKFVLYWLSGLGFTPGPVWLTDDGAYMASVSAWTSGVPEGWESIIGPLIDEQDKVAQKRGTELANALAHKPGKPVAFVHANLFDSESAELRPNSTVVVTGNKITAVGADGKVAVPANAEVVDATGKALLPGLWDMHVHISANDGLLHMANGVTSVRDMGNDIDDLAKTSTAFDQGTQIGPRVVKAGFIDGHGPYQGPTKVFADNEDEARKDVENYARLGYSQIKVYSSLKPELVPKIAEMAHSHGMRLSGHVPSGMLAADFVRAGADEIQHMNFILLNFMPQVKETRTPARFTEVAAHAAELDLSSEQVKAFVRLLQEHKTVVDPTVSIFQDMFVGRPGKMPAEAVSMAERMPSEVRRGFLYGGLSVPNGMDQRYLDSFQTMLKMTKTLYDAGVPIVAGTDDLPGFTLLRELELYVAAGIPAPKVLQLATLGAARIMKRDQQLGSIAPGKLADMVLIDGDPSSKIKDIERIRTIVKDGVVYQAAELDRAIGVKPN